MKTEKELQELQKRVEGIEKELRELSEEELDVVVGGDAVDELRRIRLVRSISK